MGLLVQVRCVHLAVSAMTVIILFVCLSYFNSSIIEKIRTVRHVSKQTANLSDYNGTGHDLAQLPIEMIYEAGHTDVSGQICPNLGEEIKLLILVASAPSHDSARLAVRKTWGHFSLRKDIAIAFVLGTSSEESYIETIEKEQEIYGDIIKGKFLDTYDNLTLKTISMLEWVYSYCPKAFFILKTDDDMFINVSRLLAFIAEHKSDQRAIYGHKAENWKPDRNIKSKYYISPQQYEQAVFPEFTTGPAYIFPAKLAKELYLASLNYSYVKLEDVFVTGIVANHLKIERIDAPEFTNVFVPYTACYIQKVISIHMVTSQGQYNLWKKLHDECNNSYLFLYNLCHVVLCWFLFFCFYKVYFRFIG